jgi:hypothetical protein
MGPTRSSGTLVCNKPTLCHISENGILRCHPCLDWFRSFKAWDLWHFSVGSDEDTPAARVPPKAKASLPKAAPVPTKPQSSSEDDSSSDDDDAPRTYFPLSVNGCYSSVQEVKVLG